MWYPHHHRQNYTGAPAPFETCPELRAVLRDARIGNGSMRVIEGPY
jgi:hypothetical protein